MEVFQNSIQFAPINEVSDTNADSIILTSGSIVKTFKCHKVLFGEDKKQKRIAQFIM